MSYLFASYGIAHDDYRASFFVVKLLPCRGSSLNHRVRPNVPVFIPIYIIRMLSSSCGAGHRKMHKCQKSLLAKLTARPACTCAALPQLPSLPAAAPEESNDLLCCPP